MCRMTGTHTLDRLQQVLQTEDYKQGKVLIFVATKRMTELLADKLMEVG